MRFAVLLAALLAAPAQDVPLRPMLGLAAPENAVVLFDGDDLEAWTHPDGASPPTWTLQDASLAPAEPASSLRTRADFHDLRLHLEFACPPRPATATEAPPESGLWLLGRYQVLIVDSYGQTPSPATCGAVAGQIAPRLNACLPPEQWQSLDLTFRAPRMVEGQLTERARLTVIHNGAVILDQAEIDPTPGGLPDLATTGPLLLRAHDPGTRYRNIWLQPTP